MTAIEWFNALQWIHIVLIMAILLLFAGYIYLLLKITQLQYVGGFIGKRKIRVFGILFGSLVVFYLFYNLHKLQPNEWVEISLLVGLVAVTGALALYAAGQADASVKMAEATEKYISEAVRPMVHPSVEFGHSQDTASGQYYIDKMNARFKNIGRGPALHVEVTCHHPCFEYEGPLSKVVLEVGEEVSLYISSSVSGIQSQKAFELIAKYQNMHGKWFCSRLTQDEHGQHHLGYTEMEGKEND